MGPAALAILLLMVWIELGIITWFWLDACAFLVLIYSHHLDRGRLVGPLAVLLLVALIVLIWPMAIYVFAIDAEGERA
jgi:hypothetical protein